MSVGSVPNSKVNYTLKTPVSSLSIVRGHNSASGYDTLSRDALLTLNSKDTVVVMSGEPMASTDNGKFTSLLAFELTKVMQAGNDYFMVAMTNGRVSAENRPANTILFNHLITKSENSGWNNQLSSFVCPDDELYVFSVSIRLSAGSSVQVDLVAPKGTYEIRRTHANYNGNDTLSRTILCQCMSNQEVKVEVANGIVEGSTDLATSFTGFRYQPDPAQSAKRAWFVSRFIQLDNSKTTMKSNRTLMFTRNMINLNMGNIPAYSVQQIECPADGTYFVHLTVESKAGVPVEAYIRQRRVNMEDILYAGIRRTSAWHGRGQDTLSRSVLLGCHRGDQLDVVIKTGTAIGSGSSELKIANSFLGFQVSNTNGDIFQ